MITTIMCHIYINVSYINMTHLFYTKPILRCITKDHIGKLPHFFLDWWATLRLEYFCLRIELYVWNLRQVSQVTGELQNPKASINQVNRLNLHQELDVLTFRKCVSEGVNHGQIPWRLLLWPHCQRLTLGIWCRSVCPYGPFLSSSTLF